MQLCMNAPDHKDPLTGEPGAHPVSTGAGAVTGGMVGAAVGGLIGGPVGAMVGVGVGGFAGGLGGKAMAEIIDATEDESHWRRAHAEQTYAAGAPYEHYHEAYRVGYEGARRYEHAEKYEDIEANLEEDYGGHSAGLPWDRARPAARAAWEHARGRGRSAS